MPTDFSKTSGGDGILMSDVLIVDGKDIQQEIDAITGVEGGKVNRTGDTMTGQLIMSAGGTSYGTQVAVGTDLSKHIELHTNGYGFNVQNTIMGYHASSSGMHKFFINGVEVGRLDAAGTDAKSLVTKSALDAVNLNNVNRAGDTMTGPLVMSNTGVDFAPGNIMNNADMSKHIKLHPANYGFNIMPNALAHHVPTGGYHRFNVNGVEVSRIDATVANPLSLTTKAYVDGARTQTGALDIVEPVNKHKLLLGKYTTGTGHTDAPTTFDLTSVYLQVGGREYGNNSYRLIGFGYRGDPEGNHAPAIIGYQEASPTANSMGRLIFATRNVTTDTATTIRMTIEPTGLVDIKNGIGFANQIATGFDLSKHINLHSGTFGMNVQANLINYIVPNGATHRFYSGTNNHFEIGPTAVTAFFPMNHASGSTYGSITSTGADLSKHIALYSSTFGFNIQNNAIGYIVPASASHKFFHGTTELAEIGGSATAPKAVITKDVLDPALATKLTATQMPAQADLAGGATLAEVITAHNALLAKLRTANILAT